MKKTDNLKFKGIYTFTKAKIKTKEQWFYHNTIVNLRGLINNDKLKKLIDKFNGLCQTEISVYKNIIPTVGRTMLANNITNASPTNTPLINYVALGTDNTAVAVGDTALGTESYRNTVASRTNSNNVAYVTGFFSATECNDTYYEAGLFSDGSGTTDSGVLFSHVLLNSPTGITKSDTESLTIDWTITLSDA